MKAIYLLIATIAFILIGLFIHRSFLELSLSMVKNENVQLTRNIIAGQFGSKFIFAILSGFIPIIYFIIQKITKISFLYKGLITIGLIMGTGILFWFVRVFIIKRQLQVYSNIEFPNEMKPSYLINGFNFENYLFFGFIIGAFISILIFRPKKSRNNKF